MLPPESRKRRSHEQLPSVSAPPSWKGYQLAASKDQVMSVVDHAVIHQIAGSP